MVEASLALLARQLFLAPFPRLTCFDFKEQRILRLLETLHSFPVNEFHRKYMTCDGREEAFRAHYMGPSSSPLPGLPAQKTAGWCHVRRAQAAGPLLAFLMFHTSPFTQKELVLQTKAALDLQSWP